MVFKVFEAILGLSTLWRHDKYLGLPSLIGHSNTQIFGFLRDRVQAKRKGWKEMLLFWGGGEVLIKAVAQSIPMYVMSCFKLPASLYLDMTRCISKF